MKRLLALVALAFPLLTVASTGFSKCVQVYYDNAPQASEKFWFSKVHLTLQSNLLGHFKNVDQKLIPIENYKRGDIERCASTIYMGTYFDNKIPEAFLMDFYATNKKVAWLGYNVWQLGNARLKNLWGVKYRAMSKLDRVNLDSNNHPGFYKFYSYKGEEFKKYGGYEVQNDPTSRFHAAFEIIKFKLLNREAANNVVSWASHSTRTTDKVPYILNKGNKWYVGDSPFSYMTEDDRYLIYSDLLFDILNEQPIYRGKKPALFRLEDIHARLYKWQLNGMVDLVKQYDIPFSMTMIPIYIDPFARNSNLPENNFVMMNWDPAFKDFIYRAKQANATFIYHGVTHQYKETVNPFNGVSGDDFEFWDAQRNKPVAEDSASFVVNRLEDGLQVLEDAGASPSLWLTPHYQASPLDYNIFGELFSWNAGRAIYFPSKTRNAQSLPSNLKMERSGASGNGQRLQYFQNLQVDYPKDLLPAGQFYPYEIFTDSYGQRMIPENVGNIQHFISEQVTQIKTVDDMIATMKRNRVLRDVWASFFLHAFTLDTPENDGIGDYAGDTRKVARLIEAAKRYGYEFVDLKDFVNRNRNARRINVTEETLRR